MISQCKVLVVSHKGQRYRTYLCVCALVFDRPDTTISRTTTAVRARLDCPFIIRHRTQNRIGSVILMHFSNSPALAVLTQTSRACRKRIVTRVEPKCGYSRPFETPANDLQWPLNANEIKRDTQKPNNIQKPLNVEHQTPFDARRPVGAITYAAIRPSSLRAYNINDWQLWARRTNSPNGRNATVCHNIARTIGHPSIYKRLRTTYDKSVIGHLKQ